MQLFSNNTKTELAVSIDAVTTSVQVIDTAGMPALTDGDSFKITVENSNKTAVEIMKVTAIVGNTLTVVRGQEGTTPSSFAALSVVEMRLTAGWLNMAGQELGTLDSKIDTLTSTVASLASAQGQIAGSTNPVFAVIPSVQTQMPFTVTIPSSNGDVFEFDDTSNLITFNRVGIYTFNSNVAIKSNVSAARTLSFKLVNNSNGTVVTEETGVFNIASGNTQIIHMNTLINVAAAPLTIRVDVQNSGTGYVLEHFSSTLVSSVKVEFGSFADFNTALEAALV